MSKLKDLASTMRRARVPVKRGQPSRKLRDVQQRANDLNPPPVYGGPLDSWEPRYRPEEPTAEASPPAPKEPTRKEPEIQKGKGPEIVLEAEAPPEGFDVKPALRLKKSKTRRKTMGLSVSEEEAALLRKAAAERGESFSAWARQVLFRAMGRKVPARPRKHY